MSGHVYVNHAHIGVMCITFTIITIITTIDGYGEGSDDYRAVPGQAGGLLPASGGVLLGSQRY